MKQWDNINIKLDNVEIKKGISPVIISASRSTDIPAFYADWFMNRLRSGYTKWINPFNRNTPVLISFNKTRVFVFWTKNPKPMLKYLDEIDNMGLYYYFQYTLNDYCAENFEPNVPQLSDRIEIFKELSLKIGKEKVIWRFDPLILTNTINVRELLKRTWNLGNTLIHYTNKLVFSFADISEYKKVKNNIIRETCFFNEANIKNAEFTHEQQLEFADGIKKILNEWKKINPNFTVATCAETIDLNSFGITHNKCIDDELMIKLFHEDKKLMNFLGYNSSFNIFSRPSLKDHGQRKDCGCIQSKDIGSYNTCNHLCVYCYANTSKTAVHNNLLKISKTSESIL